MAVDFVVFGLWLVCECWVWVYLCLDLLVVGSVTSVVIL